MLVFLFYVLFSCLPSKILATLSSSHSCAFCLNGQGHLLFRQYFIDLEFYCTWNAFYNFSLDSLTLPSQFIIFFSSLTKWTNTAYQICYYEERGQSTVSSMLFNCTILGSKLELGVFIVLMMVWFLGKCSRFLTSNIATSK